MLNKVLGSFGYSLQKKVKGRQFPLDFGDREKEIIEKVRPYSMTSDERLQSVIQSVHYTVDNKIEGSVVECGVWKGGSMMAAAMTLLERGEHNRDLYLYDTFAGMPVAQEIDRDVNDVEANEWRKNFKDEKTGEVAWCLSTLDEVKSNIAQTSYPANRLHFIEGMVEDTIPAQVPDKIALLRLDTDWYESTKHELTHLFPLLQPKGIMIIDDYGFWKGARKAVDEFLAMQTHRYFLHRIDETGRLLIKLQN